MMRRLPFRMRVINVSCFRMQQENETYFLAHDYSTLDESVRAQLSTQTCLTPTPLPDIPGSPPTFPTPTENAITPSPRTEKPGRPMFTFERDTLR